MSKIMRGFKLSVGGSGTAPKNPIIFYLQPKRRDQEDSWQCPKCGAINPVSNNKCARCAASPLSDKKSPTNVSGHL